MPTTAEEATRIVEISQEYISLDRMKELFTRLHVEVGEKSENSSLKVSLAMMKHLVDPPVPPASKWLWLGFYVLVVIHMAIVVGVAASFCVAPFLAPWYIALPLDTFIWFFCTTRVDCQITNFENRLRKRLGLPEIKGFVSHYFLKPVRKFL